MLTLLFASVSSSICALLLLLFDKFAMMYLATENLPSLIAVGMIIINYPHMLTCKNQKRHLTLLREQVPLLL